MPARAAQTNREPQVILGLTVNSEYVAYEWLSDLRKGKVSIPFIPGYNELKLIVQTKLSKPAELRLDRLQWLALLERPNRSAKEYPLRVEYPSASGQSVLLPAALQSGQPDQVSIPIRFSYESLPPRNMYTLTVRAAPDATVADGVAVPTASYAGIPLYLPAIPVPPQMTVGQPFLCVPLSGKGFPYRDPQGKPIEWRRGVLRKWTLVRKDGNLLEFAIEGTALRARYEWDGASDLPALLPMIDEPTVRALKGRYEGRRVGLR